MGKKRHRKKSQKKKTPSNLVQDSTLGQWGFDYGLSVRSAAVSSIGFSQNLGKAEIIAVAYGSDYSPDLDRAVPVITLVGRNEAPLRDAFDEFSRWADFSDADAVEVTLVFNRAAGYKFIINVEPKVLIDRTLRYDAVTDPLAFQLFWIKPIDSTSEILKDLRSHLEKGIRPYILSAATYIGVTSSDALPPELIRPVRGIKELLKFRIRFVDEESEDDKHWQELALMGGGRGLQKERRPLYIPSPEQLMKTRIDRLRVLFPVTLWRRENTDSLRSASAAARDLGLRQWQIEQAMCNAVVSRDITEGRPHFTGLKKKGWPDPLLRSLRERFEVADGKTEIVPPITSDELLHQSILDSEYLLKGLGIRGIPNSLGAIQNELSRRSLLEVPAQS